MMEIIMFLD